MNFGKLLKPLCEKFQDQPGAKYFYKFTKEKQLTLQSIAALEAEEEILFASFGESKTFCILLTNQRLIWNDKKHKTVRVSLSELKDVSIISNDNFMDIEYWVPTLDLIFVVDKSGRSWRLVVDDRGIENFLVGVLKRVCDSPRRNILNVKNANRM